jgi:hypothetical protein
MRELCPGQFKELARARLPQGMRRLAGAWTGFAVNAGSEEIHQEIVDKLFMTIYDYLSSNSQIVK